MDDTACDEYRKLLEEYPDNCHVLNNLGMCHANKREFEKAREFFVLASQTKGYEHMHATPLENIRRLDMRKPNEGYAGHLMW